VGHPVCSINLRSFDLLSPIVIVIQEALLCPWTAVATSMILQSAAPSLPVILDESISTNIRKCNLYLVHILFHLHNCKSITRIYLEQYSFPSI
jgi:hypothetical protein